MAIAVIEAGWYAKEAERLMADPAILDMAAAIRLNRQEAAATSPDFTLAAFREYKSRGGTPDSIGGPARAILSILEGLPPLADHPFAGKTDTELEVMSSDAEALYYHERVLARWQDFASRSLDNPAGEQFSLLAELTEAYIADRKARGIPDCGLPIALSRVGLR